MFFDMTKKLFLCALAVVCLFGCGKSDAEMANEKYVRASEKVVKAAQAFDEANYELALDLCKSAQNDISEILSKHQDTSIALEIVKNASINIGPCSLSDLREKVIPQLETLSKKELKPLSLPWAVALKLPPAERDTALANLAILTLYLDRTTQSLTERGLKPALSMTLKERTDAVNAILSKISSVEIKNKVMDMRNALMEEENRNLAARKAVGEQERKSEKKMRANRIESNAKIVLGGNRQMANKSPITDAVLRQAELWAKMVPYDLKASASLLETAKNADFSDKSSAEKFLEILNGAELSARKINVPKSKTDAIANIAKANAYAGGCEKAIALSGEIQNEAVRTEIISLAVSELIARNDIMHALAAAYRLPESPAKYSFLYRISVDLARKNMITEARGIIMSFRDKSLKDSCMIALVCSAPNQKTEDIIDTIKQVDPKNLSSNTVKMLSNLLSPISDSYKTEQGELAAGIASISGVLARSDKKLAEEWLECAKSIALQIKDPKDFSEVLKVVSENLTASGRAEEAYSLMQKCAFRINDPAIFDALCEAGLQMALSGSKHEAAKTFELAGGLCNSLGEGGGARAAMLSWYVALSGMSQKDAAKSLKPFLPSF